jgi:uncharacterized protein (DUF1697 family)
MELRGDGGQHGETEREGLEESRNHMARMVGFLRAVNLGGVNKFPMAALRRVLEDGGLREVETYLQSGNVLFDGGEVADESARHIESLIAKAFGMEIPVLVRERADMARIIAANPLGGLVDNPSRYAVVFLSDPADAERLQSLDPSAYRPDAFVVAGREMFIWYPNGIHESKLTVPLIERRLRVTATARNWNTVTKLLEKIGE